MQMAVRLFNCSTRLATISFKLSKKIASAWDSKIIVPYNLFEINVASLDYVIWHELLLKWLLDNELEAMLFFPILPTFPLNYILNISNLNSQDSESSKQQLSIS